MTTSKTATARGVFILASVLAAALSLAGISAVLAQDRASQAIVDLAYDPSNQTLLKTDGRTLHQLDASGVEWLPIETGDWGDGGIAAITVAAEGAGIYVAVTGVGVFRLGDDGDWLARNGDLPAGEVAALAAHAVEPSTLYAYLPESGIFRTQDGGQTWQLMDRGPGDMRDLMHSNMPGSMETGWLYAVVEGGLQTSMDCFCLWRPIGPPEIELTAVAYDPSDPERVYIASPDGIFVSLNGGLDWQSMPSPTTGVFALVVTTEGAFYAGDEDGIVFQSIDGAASWEPVGG